MTSQNAMAQQGLASGAARPGFAVGDQRIGRQQARLGQGRQPQDDAGGIAAGVAHQAGPAHLLPVQFGQAVNRLGVSTPARYAPDTILIEADLPEAEIGAQVHHF